MFCRRRAFVLAIVGVAGEERPSEHRERNQAAGMSAPLGRSLLHLPSSLTSGAEAAPAQIAYVFRGPRTHRIEL